MNTPNSQNPGSLSAPDIKSLFQQAHDEGNLSATAFRALAQHTDIGAQIAAGSGLSAAQVMSSEVVLLAMMPDDSGSIRFAGNEDAVREGHNLVLDALSSSKQKDGILAHTRYLNGTVLYPYRRLEDAERMDRKNFQAMGGTPLYDQTAVLLGTVLLKTQEFASSGIPARSVTLIITDGNDQGSREQTPGTVRALVQDLLSQETHIIAAMGIQDGSTDFHQVFSEMGIPDEWILTPGNTESEIRKAFQVFSQSAVRASQSAANFSQTALGGFMATV